MSQRIQNAPNGYYNYSSQNQQAEVSKPSILLKSQPAEDSVRFGKSADIEEEKEKSFLEKYWGGIVLLGGIVASAVAIRHGLKGVKTTFKNETTDAEKAAQKAAKEASEKEKKVPEKTEIKTNSNSNTNTQAPFGLKTEEEALKEPLEDFISRRDSIDFEKEPEKYLYVSSRVIDKLAYDGKNEDVIKEGEIFLEKFAENEKSLKTQTPYMGFGTPLDFSVKEKIAYSYQATGQQDKALELMKDIKKNYSVEGRNSYLNYLNKHGDTNGKNEAIEIIKDIMLNRKTAAVISKDRLIPIMSDCLEATGKKEQADELRKILDENNINFKKHKQAYDEATKGLDFDGLQAFEESESGKKFLEEHQKEYSKLNDDFLKKVKGVFEKKNTPEPNINPQKTFTDELLGNSIIKKSEIENIEKICSQANIEEKYKEVMEGFRDELMLFATTEKNLVSCIATRRLSLATVNDLNKGENLELANLDTALLKILEDRGITTFNHKTCKNFDTECVIHEIETPNPEKDGQISRLFLLDGYRKGDEIFKTAPVYKYKYKAPEKVVSILSNSEIENIEKLASQIQIKGKPEALKDGIHNLKFLSGTENDLFDTVKYFRRTIDDLKCFDSAKGEPAQKLTELDEELLKILKERGITHFNHKNYDNMAEHCTINEVSTDNLENDGKVLGTVYDGYKKGDKILEKAEIMKYKYKAPEAEDLAKPLLVPQKNIEDMNTLISDIKIQDGHKKTLDKHLENLKINFKTEDDLLDSIGGFRQKIEEFRQNIINNKKNMDSSDNLRKLENLDKKLLKVLEDHDIYPINDKTPVNFNRYTYMPGKTYESTTKAYPPREVLTDEILIDNLVVTLRDGYRKEFYEGGCAILRTPDIICYKYKSSNVSAEVDDIENFLNKTGLIHSPLIRPLSNLKKAEKEQNLINALIVFRHDIAMSKIYQNNFTEPDLKKISEMDNKVLKFLKDKGVTAINNYKKGDTAGNDCDIFMEIPTPDSNLNGKIDSIYYPEYQKDGKVIRNAEVSVYKYKAPDKKV